MREKVVPSKGNKEDEKGGESQAEALCSRRPASGSDNKAEYKGE